MSLFSDEDVLTKKIETWRGFIDKLATPTKTKVVLIRLLESCYEYSVAMNDHAQVHPLPVESFSDSAQK